MSHYRMRLPEGWYPHDKQSCIRTIEEKIENFKIKSKNKRAGIVPHAGWYFSGQLTAHVLKTLKENNPNPDRICLIGGHLGSYHPVFYLDFEKAETPLGDIGFDSKLTNQIIKHFPDSKKDHNTGDNTIEVSLPMIKYFFPETPLIAFRAPPSSLALELGKKIKEIALKNDQNIIVIGASDLTHYGVNYGFAPYGTGEKAVKWVKEENDKRLIHDILSGNLENIPSRSLKEQSSCSGGTIASVCAFAKYFDDYTPEIIDYYTSSDIILSDNFVGYVGITF
ncbi:MAG: AmmeMemoRadiSam system protein B [Spirochaetes bacterium GWB1_36_13]|nr:MAG: AmmeMemoRadiSam system protein B [Spirochaetes bacterium GWB1_36_13]